MESLNTVTPWEYNLQDLLYSMQQSNLVYNHNFLYFSNGKDYIQNKSGIPDGWLYNDTGKGGEITAEGECCKISTGKGDNTRMIFRQALHEFPRWESRLKGQIITAKVELKTVYEANISLTLTDGIGTNTLFDCLAGDVELEVQLAVNTEAKYINLIIESTTPGATFYIKRAYANIGRVALAGLPCIVEGVIGERKQYFAMTNPPPEELPLCNDGFQLNENYSRLDSVINKRFGTTVDGKYSLLPDMRGYFSRAWNNGSDRDPDAAGRITPGNEKLTGDYVGTVENDDFMQHDHSVNCSPAGPIKPDGVINIMGTNGSINTMKAGGKETRPKNIAEFYTVKWA